MDARWIGAWLIILAGCDGQLVSRTVSREVLNGKEKLPQPSFTREAFEVVAMPGHVRLGYEHLGFVPCDGEEFWVIEQSESWEAAGREAFGPIWRAELVTKGYSPDERWFSHDPVPALIHGQASSWADLTDPHGPYGYGHLGAFEREVIVTRYEAVGEPTCADPFG